MLHARDVDLIRKNSDAGVGYSVIELGAVRHVFASAVPRQGETLAEQAKDALSTIEAVVGAEGALGSIVMQSVFLKNLSDLAACRQILRDYYGPRMPATTYILQPPCANKLLEVEALGLGGGRGKVAIEHLNDRMTVARHDDVTWVHLADIRPEAPTTAIYDRSLDAFARASAALAAQGYRFDQVIRTWLYLGDIVGPEGETQRYRELNRARTDYYKDIKFCTEHLPASWENPVFPASTGIGANGKDVTLSAIALLTNRPDVRVMPLENPQQTSAFDYAHQYGPQSPKFARAMVVATGAYATTFVSGTASITASETQYLDDVAGQTRQTLDNIEALIAENNFRRHDMPGLGATLDDLALARVYIKRQEDYDTVRGICQARLGELPIIYAIADVCRPDLLVEIEGMAFSRRRDTKAPHFASSPRTQTSRF